MNEGQLEWVKAKSKVRVYSYLVWMFSFMAPCMHQSTSSITVPRKGCGKLPILNIRLLTSWEETPSRRHATCIHRGRLPHPSLPAQQPCLHRKHRSPSSWLGTMVRGLQTELAGQPPAGASGRVWRPRGPDWPSQVATVSLLLFFPQSFGSALGLIHLAHSPYSSATWSLKLAWEFIFFFPFTGKDLNLWSLVHCPFLPTPNPGLLHFQARCNSFLPG